MDARDYHELFKVGDIITFGNSDLPSWGAGYWRVTDVALLSARIEPWTAETDGMRDTSRCECLIVNGGLVQFSQPQTVDEFHTTGLERIEKIRQ